MLCDKQKLYAFSSINDNELKEKYAFKNLENITVSYMIATSKLLCSKVFDPWQEEIIIKVPAI